MADQAVGAHVIPFKAIGQILAEVMAVASANGANSISMPDEYVAVAHFVSYPEEYIYPATEPVDRDIEMAKVERDVALIGYGFLVDGRRVPLSRITWFNRPGERALPARVLPANVPVPWEQRVQLGQSTMRELARAQDAEIAEWRAGAAARGKP